MEIKENFSIIFSLICLLMATIFYKLYGGPKENTWDNRFIYLALTIVSLAISYGAFLVTLIFFIKTIVFLENREAHQWLIATTLIVFYGLASAFISPKKYVTYLPIIFMSLIVIGITFANTASTSIVTKLGIGGYTSSFTLDSKYTIAIENDASYKISKTNTTNVVILNDVWVTAYLPTKVILKSHKNSTYSYIIPTNAILGEVSKVSP